VHLVHREHLVRREQQACLAPTVRQGLPDLPEATELEERLERTELPVPPAPRAPQALAEFQVRPEPTEPRAAAKHLFNIVAKLGLADELELSARCNLSSSAELLVLDCLESCCQGDCESGAATRIN